MTVKIDRLLEEMRNKLRPGPASPDIKKFIAWVNSRLETLGYSAKAVAGGSLAKGTNLRDFDVDVFVMFHVSYADRDISDLLAKALAPKRPVRLHGSRDYFQIKGERVFEIVPVLAIKNATQAKNITDFSPLHAKWVRAHIQKNPRLADDIRLAKQFCKANLCYGAESYIGGFSGHVLDILVIHYKGFIPFLRAANKWKAPHVVDPMNFHKGKALFNLNKSKLGPLVLIDPLQADRNAAAALTRPQFDRFRQAASAFLAKPDESLFELPRFELEKTGNAIIFRAEPKSDKIDVAGAKLRGCYESIKTEIDRLGFSLDQAVWIWPQEGAQFIFILKKTDINHDIILEGPSASMERHAERFRSAHAKTFVKDGKLFANESRAVFDSEGLAQYLENCKYDDVKIKRGKNPQKPLCVASLVDQLIYKRY